MATDIDPRTITRVALRNYKSISACDVELTPLTFLVGPNGSGKSNFVDALRFTAQALRFTPDHALHERGGINEVRRRSRGHPNHFGIRLGFRLADAAGWYAFELGARPKGRYVVRREECVVLSHTEGRASFRIDDGRLLSTSIPHPPPTGGSDRLYLLPASAYRRVQADLRYVYRGWGSTTSTRSRSVSYSRPTPADLLTHDGSNIASVLANLKSRSPETAARVGQYLSKVVPGTVGMESKAIGPKLTLEFRQEVRGDPHPWRFLAHNVSDGTLRVLGVLVALYQGTDTESVKRKTGGYRRTGGGASPGGRGSADGRPARGE